MFDQRWHRLFRQALLSAAVVAGLWFGRGILARLVAGGVSPFVGIFHWAGFQVRRLRESGGGGAEGSLRWQLLEKDRRIAELQAELARHAGLERENLELRSLRGLEVPRGWQAVTAEVLVRDPVFWNQGFTIGKGQADQVRVGSVVMVHGQVLGRVVRSHRHLSEVAMLYSPDCRMGVRIGDTAWVGVCRGISREPGEGGGRVEVDYLPRDLEVAPGTVLCTSGLGGSLPPGLPVARALPGPDGNVVQKRERSRGFLLAEPLRPLDRFRFVVVLSPPLRDLNEGGAPETGPGRQ